MSKNTIIIIASIVVILLGAGGAIALTRGNTAKTDPSDLSAKTSTETKEAAEDLGLCTAVSTDTIKSALGSSASTLQGPDNTGVTELMGGGKGQVCVYPFEQGGSVSNGFYTSLAVYNQAEFDNIADFTATKGTDVSGVGDKAKYETSETYTGGQEFIITAIKGTNVYKFVISQPKDKVTFDETSALTALTTIAQSAKLN